MKSESGEESKEYGVFSRKLIVAAVLVGIFLMGGRAVSSHMVGVGGH